MYYNNQNMHSKTKFGVFVCMTYFRMNKVTVLSVQKVMI